MKVVWGDHDFDSLIADYILSRFPDMQRFGRYRPFRTAAFIRGGRVVGAIMMTNYRVYDAELTIVADEKPFIGLQGMREITNWTFNEAGLKRVTCRIDVNNRKSRKFAEKAGFRLEGIMRLGLDGENDAAIYGMTRQDCFWLKD